METTPGLKRFLPAAWLLMALLSFTAQARAETRLNLMSFNVWGAGQNEGKTTAQTIAAIRAAGADIVGMQETRAEMPPCRNNYCPPHGPSAAGEIARALGYYHLDQRSSNDSLWANAVISRFPIVGPTPLDLGVCINVEGRTVYLFNIHPTDYPYQPYQLLHIPYEAQPPVNTSAEAVRYAKRTRSRTFQLLEEELAAAEDAELMVITGDFNEPSDLDWTARAVAAGLHELAVPWPLTGSIESAGFIDTYRAAHPDEVAFPGFTWPSLTAQDASLTGYRDRIDFVFVRGAGVQIVQALLAGGSRDTAAVVVTPWPSDHRAVIARIDF